MLTEQTIRVILLYEQWPELKPKPPHLALPSLAISLSVFPPSSTPSSHHIASPFLFASPPQTDRSNGIYRIAPINQTYFLPSLIFHFPNHIKMEAPAAVYCSFFLFFFEFLLFNYLRAFLDNWFFFWVTNMRRVWLIILSGD